MKTTRLMLTAAALLMVAGSAVPAQQATQPRDPARPAQPGQQQQPGAQQPGQPRQPGMAQPPRRTDMAATGYQLIPTEWAIGADVVDPQGESLGSLEDLVMDTNAGRITHAVLSHGGMLGIGAREVAVPWQSFQWDHEEEHFTLQMTKERLEQAPEFNRDQIQGLGERGQERGELGFFGGQNDDAATGDDGWGLRSQYQTTIKNGQDTNVRGSVTNIARQAPMAEMNEGIIISISGEGGEEQLVHLGPAWFIDRQDVMLRLGDQVQIEGVEVQLENRQVIVAHNLNSPYGTFRLRDDQGNPIWDATTGEAGAQPGQQQRQPGQNQQPGARQPGQNQPGQNQPGAQPRPNQLQPGQQQPPPGAAAAQPGRGVPADEPLGRQQQPGRAPGGAQNLALVSDLDGQTVTTLAEEDLGTVSDVVFDALSGQAAFIVLSAGALLGGELDNVTIPWSMLRVEPDGRLLAAQVDRQRLEAAPKIEDWEDLQNPEVVNRVFQHYGQRNPFQQGARQPGMQPGQQQPGAQQPGQQPGMQPGAQPPNGQAMQRYNQLFTQGQQSTVTGTVQNVQQTAPMPGMQPISVLTIQSRPGQQPGQQPGQAQQPTTVHLAPQNFLQQQDINITQGSEVTIQGRTANIEGRQVLIASQIQIDGKNVNLRNPDGQPAWQSPR